MMSKGPVVAAVGPQADALERDGGELVGGAQDVDVTEALALEALRRDGAGWRTAGGRRGRRCCGRVAGAVALEADLESADVEDDGDGEGVVLAGEGDERRAAVGLDVGGVDDGEQARLARRLRAIV
jgi:hypothetical protein